MKSSTKAIVVGLSLVALFPLACPADLYSGSLTSGAIFATGSWSNVTTITWAVTQQGSTWSYHYEFTVPEDAKELSHIIFEVSDTFTSADLLDQGSLTATLGWYSADDGNSNPSMPDTIYGIKFQPFSEDTAIVDDTEDTWTWEIDFTSDRAPVWGDFYAVDGKKPGEIVYAYNQGFTEEDCDYNHIAVPDSVSYVPVPGAVFLGALGLGAAGLRLRRKA